MKGHLGISLIFLLGCQVLETSSRVLQSSDGQVRLDHERKQRMTSENDVIDFMDVGKYCKFLLIRNEKGERNIFYACPKRPGFKYNPHEEEFSPSLFQRGSRSKDKATPKNFKCPFPWGTFPHPKDCSKYHLCLFGKPREMTCKKSEFYDVEKEQCYKKETVDCGERSEDGKEKDGDDEKDDDKDEMFKCPYPWGTYPHKKDCSKYYLCLNRNPYTKICPKGRLYDTYSRECHREDEVDCGSRYNPREISATSSKMDASTTLQRRTTAENFVSSTTVEATTVASTTILDSTEGQESLDPNTPTNRVSTDDSTALKVTPSQFPSTNTDYYTESENLESREHTEGTGSDGIKVTDVETVSKTISEYSTRSDVYTKTPVSEKDTASTHGTSRDTRTSTSDDSSQTEELASDIPDLLTISTSSDIEVSTKTTEQVEEVKKTTEVTSKHFSIETTFDRSSSSIPEEQTSGKVTEAVTEEHFTTERERVTLSTTFKTSDMTENESDDLSESTPSVFTHSVGTSEKEAGDSTSLGTRASSSWTTAGKDEEEVTTYNPTMTDSPDSGSFVCPRKYGNFPHDSDCSMYFACREGKSNVEKCPQGTLFHISFSFCFAEDQVDCGSRKRPEIESTPGKFSTPAESTEDSRTDLTTPRGMEFSCPRKNGNFAHEERCSLYYYSCRQGVAELRQCLPGLLFSAEHNLCLSESQVNCAKATNG